MKVGDLVRLKSDHVDNILLYEVAEIGQDNIIKVTLLTTGEVGGWISENLMQPAKLSDGLKVICPYCDKRAVLVTGEHLYPTRRDLFSLWFWACDPCDAYVGTHKKSVSHEPLGRLASRDLRRWKMAAHKSFDKVWKENWLTRTEAYAWLARELKLHPRQCHIGMFDIGTCQEVIAAVEARWVQAKFKFNDEGKLEGYSDTIPGTGIKIIWSDANESAGPDVGDGDNHTP